MKPTRPTTPTRSSITCYAPDGTSQGYRTLAAAERLVSGGYVHPVYGRKGHLRAIWLLRDDGGNPTQSRARSGTRYSFIESLDNGRCWQLRRLDRSDNTVARSPVAGRDAFLQIVRDCLTDSADGWPPGAQASHTQPPPPTPRHQRRAPSIRIASR